jgi:hypothetical protein
MGGATAFSGAPTGGRTASGTAGTNAGGTSATGPKPDAVEKGLCRITIECPSEIIEGSETLCRFAVGNSSGVLEYDDHAALSIRGRSSVGFPKKNYKVELRTQADADNPTNLLGMGQDADWILDGAWADRSFMRNRLTFGLFRDASASHWAPRGRFCEVTLDAEYAGIYVLLERIKRDDDRVNLPEDDGSGSTFIVKQDDDGTLSLSIGVGNKWQLVYPNANRATATQSSAVQAWLNRFGAALKSTNPQDLLALVDRAAIVDFILVEEFAKNIDAYNLSLHFVRSGGGPAWLVPWDIDLGYGQPTLRNSTNDSPTGWISSRTTLIAKLSSVPEIRTELGPRWRVLRNTVFSNAAIAERLDGYASVLNDAAIARNFALWPIEDVDFQQIYAPFSFYDVSSYAEEMAHFRAWITQRLDWIDASIDNYPAK